MDKEYRERMRHAKENHRRVKKAKFLKARTSNFFKAHIKCRNAAMARRVQLIQMGAGGAHPKECIEAVRWPVVNISKTLPQGVALTPIMWCSRCSRHAQTVPLLGKRPCKPMAAYRRLHHLRRAKKAWLATSSEKRKRDLETLYSRWKRPEDPTMEALTFPRRRRRKRG